MLLEVTSLLIPGLAVIVLFFYNLCRCALPEDVEVTQIDSQYINFSMMNLTDNIVLVQEGSIDPLDRSIEVLSTTSEVSLLLIAQLKVVRFQLDDILLCLGDRLTELH